MKKPLFSFRIKFLPFVLCALCFSGAIARADDPLLKIQALPDQSSVKSGMMFLVHAQVTNTSADTTADFWSNTCSYEKHWVTDNSEVFIQSWTCNENTLEEITLEPGSVYAKDIMLYIPKNDKTEPVTFRLGFKRMSEDGDVAEPLWSDPVAVNVIVPEETEEAAQPAVMEATSKTSDQAPVTPAEADQASSVAVSDPAASGGNEPLVFQDPGVPITVWPDEEFSITLAGNPSTGFGWKMTLPEDQKAVKFLGSAHAVPPKMMPGAPREEVYKFKAMTPGETKVDFVYERPWEPKTAPTRKIFTILVKEN